MRLIILRQNLCVWDHSNVQITGRAWRMSVQSLSRWPLTNERPELRTLANQRRGGDVRLKCISNNRACYESLGLSASHWLVRLSAAFPLVDMEPENIFIQVNNIRNNLCIKIFITVSSMSFSYLITLIVIWQKGRLTFLLTLLPYKWIWLLWFVSMMNESCQLVGTWKCLFLSFLGTLRGVQPAKKSVW